MFCVLYVIVCIGGLCLNQSPLFAQQPNSQQLKQIKPWKLGIQMGVGGSKVYSESWIKSDDFLPSYSLGGLFFFQKKTMGIETGLQMVVRGTADSFPRENLHLFYMRLPFLVKLPFTSKDKPFQSYLNLGAYSEAFISKVKSEGYYQRYDANQNSWHRIARMDYGVTIGTNVVGWQRFDLGLYYHHGLGNTLIDVLGRIDDKAYSKNRQWEIRLGYWLTNVFR